jgi:hypothetical protein
MDQFDRLAEELRKDREIAEQARARNTPEYLASYIDSSDLYDDMAALLNAYMERFSPERMLRMVEVMEKAVSDFLGEELTPGQLGSPFTQMMVRQEFEQSIKPLLQMYAWKNASRDPEQEAHDWDAQGVSGYEL